MTIATPIPCTVVEALERVSTHTDQGFYFIQEDGSERYYPYETLVAQARQRAGALQSLGMKPGDRLALIIPESHEFVVSFFAALLAGVLPVPMYPPFALARLKGYLKSTAQILNTAGASVLLTTRRVQSLLWTVTDDVPGLKHLATVNRLDDLEAPFIPVEVLPDSPAFLQFTSGSTAAPRGVVVTHGNLVANCVGITRDGLKTRPYVDKGLSWLPLYHDMGLIGFVMAPLFVPLSVVFMPTLAFMKRPLSWLELIHTHRATITFAPNFAYALATRRVTEEHLARWDLSCLRAAGCGAEPILAETLRGFADKLAPTGFKSEALFPCYGMAEATLSISFKPMGEDWRSDRVDAERFRLEGLAVPADPERDSLEFVSCGSPFPGHSLRVVDEEGHPLEERQVGELEFVGPSVTAGYYQNPEETARVFVQGAVRTGDLGYMADGEVFVSGRRKDLIIINGRNYFPQTIEVLAEELPGVRRGNVVAFSRPGPKSTEELIIVLEARDEDHAAIRQAVSRRIGEELGLAVGEVVVLPAGSLPKTSSGKLQRRKTCELYVAGALGQEGVRTPGQTGQMLQLTGHVLRAMVSRVRHTVRQALSGEE